MKRAYPILKNKYFLTLITLSIWVIFFDKNDLKTQIEFKNQVKKLQEERNSFAKDIHDINSDINELYTDPRRLEKFAREKYLMKRDNEDIFILVEKK